MSNKQGKVGNHRFHGDPNRFAVLAAYINENYQGKVKTIADVAGGQGMLSRILSKKYNFDCEVVDPRGYPLIGVKNRKEEYHSNMADYYDLIVGLHPDEALKEVVYSAIIRPVIVIPCCNFWSRDEVLGREELLKAIEEYYQANNVSFERIAFCFSSPKNIGLVSVPPKLM